MTPQLLLADSIVAYLAQAPRNPDGSLTGKAQADLRRLAALAHEPEALADLVKPQEQPSAFGEWEEGKHPRAHGKFAKKANAFDAPAQGGKNLRDFFKSVNKATHERPDKPAFHDPARLEAERKLTDLASEHAETMFLGPMTLIAGPADHAWVSTGHDGVTLGGGDIEGPDPRNLGHVVLRPDTPPEEVEFYMRTALGLPVPREIKKKYLARDKAERKRIVAETRVAKAARKDASAFAEDWIGTEDDWFELAEEPSLFAEEDWHNEPGPRSKRRWVHKSGRVVYSDTNPGASKAKGKTAGKTPTPSKPARPAKLTVDAAHAHIQGLIATPPADMGVAVQELAQHLMGLTVTQLGELKGKLGLKASGAKLEYATKIAERALAGAKQKKPEPEAAKQPETAKEPEPEDGEFIPDDETRLERRRRLKSRVAAIKAERDALQGTIPKSAGLPYLHTLESNGIPSLERQLGYASRKDKKTLRVDLEKAREIVAKDKVLRAQRDALLAELDEPAPIKSAAQWRADPVLAAMGDRLNIRDTDHPKVAKNLDHLSMLPQRLVEECLTSGLRGIHVGNAPAPELDSMQYLRGMRPRGHEGGTWDRVAGCYDNSGRQVIAGVGAHASVSLALHEFGHAVGDSLGLDYSDELITHHQRLHAKLQPYLQQDGPGGYAGRQELLAEGLALAIMDEDDARRLYDDEFVDWIKARCYLP